MAASPIPNVKRRNLVPSDVKRIDRRRDRPRKEVRTVEKSGLKRGYFTSVAHPSGQIIHTLLDRNGNGLDDVEHHLLRLFEALRPHAMGPVQHDTMGQYDRRQL